ncbi:glycoside hydrolase domain-containing protein [Thomasclavelia cocleata]|jgi:peptidoglycan hydrolase-like protein with peptidoglycan-binding domain|uniref:glycoside hydrolase domain-containing protein n=1 Tax=Thomasclavelia cocleata TaxID=69824 RepID=UPI00241D9127|nr:glycoside hydrolase domain-containing protein [Thomasclavelia cocleata]
MDAMVLATQKWLNSTYGNDKRFNRITEDGLTGWNTIYALRRALQIEENITETSNNFGDKTYSLCPNINQGATGNLVYIVQGGLWCKGYNPGGLDGIYGNATYTAVKKLKSDMGFPTASGNMNKDIMRGLLDMNAFTLLRNGTDKIRSVQQAINYDYYDYYRIVPCDGLYGRELNKALIYALQKEFGIPKASATGTFGPTTTSSIKEYSKGTSNKIIKIVKYALICNGYGENITLNNTYDDAMENAIEQFASFYSLNRIANVCGKLIIMGLLSSSGDTSRSAKACDCATILDFDKALALKNAGYTHVGRYLTGTVGSTTSKALTRAELNEIFRVGLRVFTIYQDGGASSTYFNAKQGKIDAEKAVAAANNLGFKEKTIIYFAVDYDFTYDQMLKKVVPYFKEIKKYFARSINMKNFRIGIYASRYICTCISNYGYASSSFVADMSRGYSGNLGYKIPNNWAFDQFNEYKFSYINGTFDLDKVAYSGRYIGEGAINALPNTFEEVLDFIAKKRKLQRSRAIDFVSSLPLGSSADLSNMNFDGKRTLIYGNSFKPDGLCIWLQFNSGFENDSSKFLKKVGAINFDLESGKGSINWQNNLQDALQSLNIFSSQRMNDITALASKTAVEVKNGDVYTGLTLNLSGNLELQYGIEFKEIIDDTTFTFGVKVIYEFYKLKNTNSFVAERITEIQTQPGPVTAVIMATLGALDDLLNEAPDYIGNLSTVIIDVFTDETVVETLAVSATIFIGILCLAAMCII